eukprot:scaffold21341_cov88-Isochrysis_galbana.AAC.1
MPGSARSGRGRRAAWGTGAGSPPPVAAGSPLPALRRHSLRGRGGLLGRSRGAARHATLPEQSQPSPHRPGAGGRGRG